MFYLGPQLKIFCWSIYGYMQECRDTEKFSANAWPYSAFSIAFNKIIGLEFHLILKCEFVFDYNEGRMHFLLIY